MSNDTLDDIIQLSAGSEFERQKPKKLGVAVSGGGDSMACLDLMIEQGALHGFPVEAITVNHNLRTEAKQEIALVAEYCTSRGISHSVLEWNWDKTGNLQAEARKARYRLIAGWAIKRNVDWIALGHTMDDLAETFLMRLARKSGVDGLAQMDARFQRLGVTWIRPVVACSRQDLRTYNRTRNIIWAEDPSNDDPTFDRVKARQVLEALGPLGINSQVLASVAANLKLTQLTLDHYVRETERRYVSEDKGDLLLPIDQPADNAILPREIHMRLFREAIRWIGGGDYAPRSAAMMGLERAMSTGEPHTLGGCLISPLSINGEKNWRITREYNTVKDLSTPTNTLWDGRWHLSGPHADDLEIRALGEAVKDTPWRETGMPRQSLLASPAIWRGDTLIAAPVAGLSNAWTAEATGRGNFADFLLSR